MDAILTRSKQNLLSVYWEPFATSTPLKPVSNNVAVEHVLQKQPTPCTTPVNILSKSQNQFSSSDFFQNQSFDSKQNLSKRARNNAPSDYFDILTSSDEDEPCENKKRPIIKLSTTKKTRSLLSIQKLGSGDTEILNKSKKAKKIRQCKEQKTEMHKQRISAVTDNTTKISSSPKRKDNSQLPTETLYSSFKNSNYSSGEENEIFGDSKSYKKSVNNIKSFTKPKENLDKPKKGSNRIPESNDTPAANSTKAAVFEKVKSSFKKISKDKKPTKTARVSAKKVKSITSPVKSCTRKRSQNKTESLKPRDTGTPMHLWQKKQNLSHQLFSDSKEQEFINMLDLTKEESNEAAKTAKYSSEQKENNLPLNPYNTPHPSVENVCSEEIKQERPKRKKQSPKKFWLPVIGSDKPVSNVTTQQKNLGNNLGSKISDNFPEVLKKKYETGTSSTNLKSNKGAKHTSVKRQKTDKERTLKKRNVNKEKVIESNNGDNIKLNDRENCLISHQPGKTNDIEDAQTHQNFSAETKDSVEKPVFQKLSELTYKRNESGCSVEQCWTLHNFKCGVFRQKVKGKFSCKTLHKTSYLGGVLVKGEVKMKIGDEELDLKEGDMALVPPLTKWEATNTGDSESVFYYWCGRFNG